MKKLIIFFAGLFLVSGVAVFAYSPNYSQELNEAYEYAYSLGITTQSPIYTANMNGNLIRSHMAKMMVMYATEVLGLEPNEYKVCEFDDIANQSEELRGYIIQACQMGLMGVGVTSFNPSGVVTRAQFGTVMSRALFGDTYNGGVPYYKNHLNALKDFEVMNNIDTPTMAERRGYVMLMMQRAEEKLIEMFGEIEEDFSDVTEFSGGNMLYNNEVFYAFVFSDDRDYEEEYDDYSITLFAPTYEGDEIFENIVFETNYLDEDFTLDDLYQASIAALSGILPDYVEISTEDIQINDLDAKKIIFEHTLLGSVMKQMLILIVYDEFSYTITYTAGQNTFDDYIDDVNDIIDSYVIY